MSNLLLFSISFTLLCFFSAIISNKKGWDGMTFFSIAMGIIFGFLLFVPVGLSVGVSGSTSPVKCEVVKTSRAVLVDDGSKIWEFNDHKDYNEITDKSKFIHVNFYNMYGSICGTELKRIK